MIQKITKGSGFRGVLDYALGEGKGATIIDSNMVSSDARGLAREFALGRAQRPRLKADVVVLTSLALKPGESLSDEQWQYATRRYLSAMGFTEQNQYIAVRHADTEHQHIHIISSRAGLDGSAVDVGNDFARGEEVMRELELTFGLTQVRPSREAPLKALTKEEIEMFARTGETSVRASLQEEVKAARDGCKSFDEFVQRCTERGIEIVPTLQKNDTHLSGIQYRLANGDTMKGSDLGKSYSAGGFKTGPLAYDKDRCLEALRENARAADERRRGVDQSAARERSAPHSTRRDEGGRELARTHDRDEATPKADERSSAGIAESERRGVESPARSEDAHGVHHHRDSGIGDIHDSSIRSLEDLAAPAIAAGATSTVATSPAIRAKEVTWAKQSAALDAEKYRVTFIPRREGLRGFTMQDRATGADELSSEQVRASLPYMSRQNARGYDVAVTPIDRAKAYILVDDVKPDALQKMKRDGYAPAVVLETSTKNFQVVLRVPKLESEEGARRAVAANLNRDQGDAKVRDAAHAFRVAAFNVKKENRGGVFVRLAVAVNRNCAKTEQHIKDAARRLAERTKQMTAEAVRVFSEGWQGVREHVADAFMRAWQRARSDDKSVRDFAAALSCRRREYPADEVREAMRTQSPELAARHPNVERYLDTTMANVEDVLTRTREEQQRREDEQRRERERLQDLDDGPEIGGGGRGWRR